ncbi:hypothetical protein [Streptomyces sp. NBC_01483]|uniref:hypothetical protein n=1 Tax=Streptomyces sp. NBC_01483 TaxID=2903883 RepID=UPI002E32A3E9|nr:hypothetical protein [Streptomyces sp. NBC_01483]
MSVEHEKQLAAEAAAELIEDGMTVGLGTGSTVAYLLPALAHRGLSLRCVATSPRTEEAALMLDLRVEPSQLTPFRMPHKTGPARGSTQDKAISPLPRSRTQG